MKVIIVGLGRTGMLLLGALAREEYDIVVIDKDEDLVEFVTDKYDVDGVTGSGASRETLLKAGADTADAIISLAQTDEVNLLSCMRAKNMGTRYAAARVYQKDLVGEAESIKSEYQIDDLLVPYYDAAKEIYENIGLPGFSKVGGIFGSETRFYSVNVLENSVFNGRSVHDVQAKCKDQVRVAGVLRQDKFFIPEDDFMLKADDNLTILTVQGDHSEAMESLGIKRQRVKKIAVVGGGVISQYFLELLEKQKVEVDIFENDPDLCITLMTRFPKYTIHYTGVETINVLGEKGMDSVDMVLSATEKDEENLVVSMYAWSSKVPSVVTHMDNPEHVQLLHKVNIDITVSAAESCVLRCMRFLRNHERSDSARRIRKFYFAAEGEAELVELIAGLDFAKINTPMKKGTFHVKKGVKILTIMREGESIVPDEDTCIKDGDHVIVVTKRKMHLRSLNEILAGHRG